MKDQPDDHMAIPDTRHIGKNLLGALLIFVLCLLLFITILLPEIIELIRHAIVSKETVSRAIALGSVLFAGILFTTPIWLIVQTFIYFQNSQKLDRMGILTKGVVLEKWVDDSDDEPLYHIRYKYLLDLTAIQMVNRDAFQQIECNQIVPVLHLEHAPHLSRLVPSLAEYPATPYRIPSEPIS